MWNKEYSPDEFLSGHITDEKLEKFLKSKNIELSIKDNPSRWYGYSYYYASKRKEFDDIIIPSFSYIITFFMTGEVVLPQYNIFKEEKMKADLIEYKEKLKRAFPNDEKEQVTCMFLKIVKIFTENISMYEYATEKLSLRLTPSQMRLFKSVDGGNNKEKFENLLLLFGKSIY